MNAASIKKDTGELDLSKLSRTRKGAASERELAEQRALSGLDGRTLRRKNRTVAISWKVKPETKETIHRIAETEGMTYVEVLEAAINDYEEKFRERDELKRMSKK